MDIDFAKFREHLAPAEHIFLAFASKSGFERSAAEGRFPRIQLWKDLQEIVTWFDLTMELDQRGNRYTSFFPELPYSLAAGAFYDEHFDNGFMRHMWHLNLWKGQFNHMPDLREVLEAGYTQVATITKAKLLSGDKKQFVARQQKGS